VPKLSAVRDGLRQAPGTVLVFALLLTLQAAAFLGFGLFEATQLHGGRVMTGLMTALLLVAWGVALVTLAGAAVAGRGWSRGPAVALELIHIPVAWSFLGGRTTWVAVALGVSSLVAVVLVLLPPSTAHLVGPGRRSG